MRKLILVVSIGMIWSCKPRQEQIAVVKDNSNSEHSSVHWGYPGDSGAVLPDQWPDHWPDCGGNEQSPIHVVHKSGTSLDLKVDYQQTEFTVTHNGHTIQFTPADPNKLITTDKDGRKFKMIQFHIHTPAEHLFSRPTNLNETIHFPGEIHFVHKYADDIPQDLPPPARTLLVYGVFFQEGTTSDPTFEPIIQLATNSTNQHKEKGAAQGTLAKDPQGKHETGLPQTHRLDLYEEMRAVFYEGSLTTPPCSELVNWYVRPTAVTIESSLLQRLAAAIGTPNNRPAMGARHL